MKYTKQKIGSTTLKWGIDEFGFLSIGIDFDNNVDPKDLKVASETALKIAWCYYYMPKESINLSNGMFLIPWFDGIRVDNDSRRTNPCWWPKVILTWFGLDVENFSESKEFRDMKGLISFATTAKTKDEVERRWDDFKRKYC